jgi:glycosyltransferase involved in cell wall biosynthesis
LTLAVKEKADLYIVHHPEALGAGAAAARRNKAKLGFDAEDFHTGMNGQGVADRQMVSFLEKKYLPRCSYLSAASTKIGMAYSDLYRIRKPFALLNVFPQEPLTVQRSNTPVRFYWYSQVIGPNRGLESLLEAAGQLNSSFEIHLRGNNKDKNYRLELERLMEKTGIRKKVFFHEAIVADQLIKDGNNFDVGLALELNTSVNAMLCVSNKLFSYLMSGLAVVATDTDGQKDILQCFPEVGRLCTMGDPSSLADVMKFYIENPESLTRAKQAARSVAEKELNWENESGKLISQVDATLTNNS